VLILSPREHGPKKKTITVCFKNMQLVQHNPYVMLIENLHCEKYFAIVFLELSSFKNINITYSKGGLKTIQY